MAFLSKLFGKKDNDEKKVKDNETIEEEEGLTEEELAERAALRTEYIREFRASMTGILDNTVIIRPDGTREQVKDKNKGKS